MATQRQQEFQRWMKTVPTMRKSEIEARLSSLPAYSKEERYVLEQELKRREEGRKTPVPEPVVGPEKVVDDGSVEVSGSEPEPVVSMSGVQVEELDSKDDELLNLSCQMVLRVMRPDSTSPWCPVLSIQVLGETAMVVYADEDGLSQSTTMTTKEALALPLVVMDCTVVEKLEE